MRHANPGYIATRKVDWCGDTNRPFHNLHAGFQISQTHDRGVRGSYFDRHRIVDSGQASDSGIACPSTETGFQSPAVQDAERRPGAVLVYYALYFAVRLRQLYELVGSLAPI